MRPLAGPRHRPPEERPKPCLAQQDAAVWGCGIAEYFEYVLEEAVVHHHGGEPRARMRECGSSGNLTTFRQCKAGQGFLTQHFGS